MYSPSTSPLSHSGNSNEERWRAHLDGIRAGDSGSLGHLYDETSSILYGLALQVLNNAADAEEVVLDVYKQVWRSIQTFDPERGTVIGWLTVLTRSRAIDRLRSGSARLARAVPIERDSEIPSMAPVPESQSIFRQERRLIRQALEALVPEQREAIEMAFFKGLTHMEVAEALGAPLGTIKSRIRGGMRRLREILAPVAS